MYARRCAIVSCQSHGHVAKSTSGPITAIATSGHGVGHGRRARRRATATHTQCAPSAIGRKNDCSFVARNAP